MRLPEELLFSIKKRVPAITSAEAAECGLACIAMVACYHGHQTDLYALRQRFPTSMAGVNLRGLMKLAEGLGLSSRALRVDMEDLQQVRLPAILHWNLNHFIVLVKVTNRSFVIHDPAVGRRVLHSDQFSDCFTGVLLEFEPLSDFEPVQDRVSLKITDLWSKGKGIGSSIGLVLTLSLLLQLLSFALPFQMQLVIDQGIGRNDQDILTVIAVVFGAVIVLQNITGLLRDWCIVLFSNQFILQMASNLMRHLIRLPSSYFEKRHVGDLISRMGATHAIHNVLTQGLTAAIIDGLIGIVAGLLLFIYAPALALIVVVSIIIIMIINAMFYGRLRFLSEEAIKKSALEQSYLMETLRAIPTIKLYGNEISRENSWKNLFVQSMNSSVAIERANLICNTLVNSVLGIQLILVVYIGARDVLSAAGLSLGMLTAFLAYRQTFTDRCLSFTQQIMQLKLIRLQVDRVADIVLQPREPDLADLDPIEQAELSFVDVSFRYGETDKWVLRNVNLTIRDGEFVAIVGPSGGGKTTLLKLMIGLLTPTEGKILIDGRPATPERWRALRERTGVVSQTDNLFSGSLADNIAFFDPDMDLARVHSAATRARLNEEIREMPMRYNTLIGDMGSSLSGGQQQRVLLARALYRDPAMLMLDEGTANLDPKNEEAIAELVAGLEITRIVVAHRPSLMRKAQRLLVVENGTCEDAR